MKTTLYLIQGMIVVLIMASCSGKQETPPESKCGTAHDDHKAWNTTSTKDLFPWDEAGWGSYIEGTARVFQAELDPVVNVCPYNLITLSLRAEMKPFPERAIDIRVLYRYGPLGISGDTLHMAKMAYPDRVEYVGSRNFGIADAYAGQPGSFYLIVQWVVAGQQDYAADLAYLQSQFIFTDAGYTWYGFKP